MPCWSSLVIVDLRAPRLGSAQTCFGSAQDVRSALAGPGPVLECDFSRAAVVGSRGSVWEFFAFWPWVWVGGHSWSRPLPGSVGTARSPPSHSVGGHLPGCPLPASVAPPRAAGVPRSVAPPLVGQCVSRGRSRLPPQNTEKQHHHFIMRRRLPPRGGGVAFWSGGWVRSIVPVVHTHCHTNRSYYCSCQAALRAVISVVARCPARWAVMPILFLGVPSKSKGVVGKTHFCLFVCQ